MSKTLNKNLISEFKGGNIAFIIGNGINRYKDNIDTRSWDNLILDIYNETASIPLKVIPEKGITNPELFDITRLNTANSSSRSFLQDKFISKLKEWKFGTHHKNITSIINKYNCPILTMNFDTLMADSVGAKHNYTLENKKRGWTAIYPWQDYFAIKPLSSENDGFSIWHINGMKIYKQSLRLSLSEYIGNTRKARKYWPTKNNPVFGPQGSKTWLKFFLTKSLCIFGLGLEDQEVFIRWLLIERAKIYKIYPNLRKNGWYLNTNEMEDGKRLFLESVGFEIIQLESYQDLYEGIWENL
jgi:hypothetical protein